ncbi:MAG: dienelactone hydrolase family protein [Alphaproteobacteria bacterium]|nr:MAG: dienelactone hydrolase family protein [Alphaproteobacteria bacterium]
MFAVSKPFAAMFLFLMILAGPLRAAELDLPYKLSKPAGDGPFPAVVILHDCSGLGPFSSGAPWRWSTRLVARGYVTIEPDSFSTRDFPNGLCRVNSHGAVNYARRAGDAFAALQFLKSLPYVDPDRIAVMGGSHGGASTLATVAAHPGFAAGIALYPNCAARFGDWHAIREKGAIHHILGYEGIYHPESPLLILIGELDDWTPAAACRELTARAKEAGYPVELIVYPGAHHSFDSSHPVKFNEKRRNVNAKGGWGATTGGNPAAWKDAIGQVEHFLEEHMPGTRRRVDPYPD